MFKVKYRYPIPPVPAEEVLNDKYPLFEVMDLTVSEVESFVSPVSSEVKKFCSFMGAAPFF